MALTSDAVFSANDGNIPQPSGYTKPTTAISLSGDILDIGPYTYSMTASSGVSTTPTLGLDALITAFETFISGTFVPTTLGVDTVSDTVNAIATITKIVVGDDPADIYENDATRTFEITFTLQMTVV